MIDNVETNAINPNEDVVVCCFVIGNIYRNSITEIVDRYSPDNDPMMSTLFKGGISELIKLAEEHGISLDTNQFYSACDICRDIVNRLRNE